MAESETKPFGRSLQDRVLIALEVIVGLTLIAAIMGKAYGPAPTVIFLIAGAAATYTGYNMLRMITSLNDPTLEIQGRIKDERREALEYEKKLILQGIKELEADFGVGKVDDRDYATLRTTAEAKALSIIAQLRQDDERWRRRAQETVARRVPDLVPPEPTKAKTEPSAGAEPSAPTAEPQRAEGLFDNRPAAWRADGDAFVCTACGATNDADGRYCQACGRPRGETLP